MFVNNATHQWGLLARYKVVVLDEVQTLQFENPGEIIGGLKGYLANGTLTRGGLHQTASDCGLVLLANIALDDHQRPIVDPLVRELPEFMRETAFLDRLKGILPGWEIRKLSSDSFAKSVGLKMDYFGDTLIALREEANPLEAENLQLDGGRTYQRNQRAVRDIASGLMKLLFPHAELTPREFHENCAVPALRLRQLVWDQLYTLDAEYQQYERMLSIRHPGET